MCASRGRPANPPGPPPPTGFGRSAPLVGLPSNSVASVTTPTWTVAASGSVTSRCVATCLPVQRLRQKPGERFLYVRTANSSPVRRVDLTRAYLTLPTSCPSHRGHHDAGIACKKIPTANPAIPSPNSAHPLISSLLQCSASNATTDSFVMVCARVKRTSFIGYPVAK